ncbi:MAG: hypothetical protein M0Q40_00900 [Limnochordia bacterium]|nr:hypothetical protein [Limnochordia bacterium]
MTSREVVVRSIRFENPGRLPRNFPSPFGSDFYWTNMSPNPDARPKSGIDEWGCVWENLGFSNLGEVKVFPITDWSELEKLRVPDFKERDRFAHLKGIRQDAGDRFIIATGVSIYERAHFLRGLENLWADIHLNPRKLGQLLDILVDLNLAAISEYAKLGVDGYTMCDDWGLQDRLMISPEHWRAFWRPRYQKIFDAVKRAGMLSFLHSCGYILDILDDLVEIGLDVIQIDQQENMGLEVLGERFQGRITFFAPVDIQRVMYQEVDQIRSYCRKMVQYLASKQGGFIPCWYADPHGVGHSQEAIEVMCNEFLKLSEELYTDAWDGKEK